MFIIKFMSGLVENVTGDKNVPFEPYSNRKVEHTTTYAQTMVHLLKGAIGAGILAMPDACRRLGIINSAIGIVLIVAFATYCLHLLIYGMYEICKREKVGYMPYNQSMRVAVRSGPPCCRRFSSFFYLFTESLLVIWQLGVCAIYFVFVGVNLQQVLEFYKLKLELRLLISLMLPLEIILNLVRNLKLMTPMSMISNIAITIGMLLVMFYIIEDEIVITKDKYAVKNFLDVPFFIGTTLFAMEAVGVVLALEYSMDDPRHFVGVCGALSISMMIVFGLFTVVGISGYLKYGDNTKASITLNLPSSHLKAQVATLSFAFALFLSFPLQNYVAYELLWRRVNENHPHQATKLADYSLRIGCVLVPYMSP